MRTAPRVGKATGPRDNVSMTSLRLVFAGSPLAAVPSLTRLHATGAEIVAVITRVESAQGRRRTVLPTPVAAAAAELALPLITSNRLDDDVTAAIAAREPDLGVIVAYGGLVRRPLLSVPRLGWINLHFSLLPRWRGAAPVQHALIAGDDITGAAVFQLVPELDAGDVFGTFSQPIGAHQTAGSLLDSLAEGGAELLAQVVQAIAAGTAVARPQVGDVTLAPKLTGEDGELDWALPARELYDRFRGVTPEPGATAIVDGIRLKILDAAPVRDHLRVDIGAVTRSGDRVLIGTGTEPLELIRVQPESRRPMPATDWWRGRSASRAGNGGDR